MSTTNIKVDDDEYKTNNKVDDENYKSNIKVDEDEYLELLPERTALMLLSRDQLWSPTLTTHGWTFVLTIVNNS